MRASKIMHTWMTGVRLGPGDILGVNTTADGWQVYGSAGDSNTSGSATGVTTVPAGILQAWNGTSYDNITTQSIADDGVSGSAWQKFAIDHNANTGKKIAMYNGGVPGSNLAPSGPGDDHWGGAAFGTGNDMYANFKTNLDAAVAAKGLTKPRAIFIVGLGINDIESANSIADMETGLNALLDALETDYPGVPILYTTTGKGVTATLTNPDSYNLRRLQVEAAEDRENVYIVGSGASCIGAGFYVDDRHYSLAGQEHFGACYARWFKNAAYSKWPRSIISSHFDELPSARKATIETQIMRAYNAGILFLMDLLYFGPNTAENNFFLDWTFLGHSNKSGTPTFNANTSIETPGNNSHTYQFVDWQHPGTRSSVEDYVLFGRVITRSSTGNASFFGGEDVTGGRWIGQLSTGPFTIYRSNDATTSNGPGQLLTANKFHGIGRNAGTKEYYIDTVVSDSEAVASTAAGTVIARIGARNTSGGSATSASAASFGEFYKARRSGFDNALMQEICTIISASF